MANAAEIVVRNLIGAWENPDHTVIRAYFSKDAIWINGPRGVHRGVDEVVGTYCKNMTPTSNFRTDIKALVSDGHTVMVERVDLFRISGVDLALPCVAIFDVGADDLITRWQEYYDLRSFEDEQLRPAGLGRPSPA